MLTPLSKIQQALKDTLFVAAEGTAFSRICGYYGMRRPLVIRPDYWRNACRSTVFSAKGTAGPIFKFLEHSFGEWIDNNSTFTGVAVSPNVIEFDSATPAMENRFCRINGKLYRSSALLNGGVDGQLSFIYSDTTLFSAADFTGLAEYTVAFLPFEIVEHGCEYKVLLDDGILNFPPTYLRENGEERGTDPLGGHILDFTSSEDTLRFADPLGDGAFPAYLGDDDFTSAFGEAFLNLLAAGVRGRIIDYKWARGVASIYGSIYTRRVYGTTSVEPPDLITPTRG